MNTLIYAKYSNDRSRRFSIRTEILEDETGNIIVRKLPAYPEGEAHVASLCRYYRLLCAQTEGTRLTFNHPQKIPEGVEFDYLTGISLEEQLLDTLHHQGIETCVKELTDCLRFIRDLHVGSTFAVTDQFREVFGDAAPAPGTVCAPYTDIDLLAANIFVEGGTWTAIDYEWTFDFPVPVNYLLYRIILHFTDHANRGEEFKRFDLIGKMGISAEEQALYADMETHFQQYILGDHVPVSNLYRDISSGYVQTEDYLPAETLQIFCDVGHGINETDSVQIPMFYTNHWEVSRTVDIPDGTRRIRIDPGSHPAMVHLKTLHFDNQKTRAAFTLHEGTVMEDWLYFSEEDPKLFLSKIPEGARQLLIELEVYDAAPEAMAPLRPQAEKISRQLKRPLKKIRRNLHEHR